jgi:hypothetical protein
VTDRLHINLELDRIFCHDEGDGWGDAEPYLWTVFFKIDGSTLIVADDLTLSGNATIQTTLGSHGNLNNTDVDEGDNVVIPAAIGHFDTILEPIPLSPPWDQLADPIGGVVGVVAVLMEEDNVTDDGAEAGHRALNDAVRNALNQIVSTRSLTNQDVTDEEIAGFTSSIESAVSDAIQNQQNWFENLWSWINPDDSIGTEVFLFSYGDLESGGTINFNRRWRNEGDWEIFGHITSTVMCPAEAVDALLGSLFSSRTMSLERSLSKRRVIDLDSPKDLCEPKLSDKELVEERLQINKVGRVLDLASLRRFRDGPFKEYEGLGSWWKLAQRNLPAVVTTVLRHEELREPARVLSAFVNEFARNPETDFSDEALSAARDFFLGLKKYSTRRRLAVDASRALTVLPMLAGHKRHDVLTTLSTVPPARHPSLRDTGVRITKTKEVQEFERQIGFRQQK